MSVAFLRRVSAWLEEAGMALHACALPCRDHDDHRRTLARMTFSVPRRGRARDNIFKGSSG